jgi:uncharacterized repeat protein (TIGR03803 family)
LYELFLASTGPVLSDRFDFDPISDQGRSCFNKKKSSPPRFSNSTGAFPNGQLASLPSAPHVLYGTSVYGGSNGSGAIYSYDTIARTAKLSYSFDCGSYPAGGLMYHNGAFYGTTYNSSVVFKFVP